jgi:uncharacterized membrane protein
MLYNSGRSSPGRADSVSREAWETRADCAHRVERFAERKVDMLSAEERRRIYEEEKARIEAEAPKATGDSSSTNLSPNAAALLCYLGGWITGIVFLILEKKSAFVRFHAAQSIFVFGVLHAAGILLSSVPVTASFLVPAVAVLAFILWIVLMVRAYRGELVRVPVAGELAEKLAALPRSQPGGAPARQPETRAPAGGQVAGSAGARTGGGDGRSEAAWLGRIVASGMAIAWSAALLVLFHFYRDYVAYYHLETVGADSVWMREPFLTAQVVEWLPVLTVALIASILGHAVLIAYDRYVLREGVLVVLDLFSIAAVATLLAVFPFDFSVVLFGPLADALPVVVTVVLGGVTLALGIGVIVRLIKLIANLVRGTARY